MISRRDSQGKVRFGLAETPDIDVPVKQKYLIPRECLDAKGNLKPDSPCAEKMRQKRQNEIKP